MTQERSSPNSSASAKDGRPQDSGAHEPEPHGAVAEGPFVGPGPGRPAWASEVVHVVEADPTWAIQGQRLAAQTEGRLGSLTTGVHHIGSTAVPGLAAKPVIDLMASVSSLELAPEAAKLLEPENWHFVPCHLDARPWRRFFVKGAGSLRIAHLHLMRPDSARWREHLVFRDRLRADAALAGRYVRLKRALAVSHPHDREAYTRGKGAFIRAVVAGETPCS